MKAHKHSERCIKCPTYTCYLNPNHPSKRDKPKCDRQECWEAYWKREKEQEMIPIETKGHNTIND